ncbi:MAG: ankyrin repeat domain-containing protein [Epsilonproteobacteria bacterium]|nr:ankyrin repeat domain-containing protein [Campylobacterota bacterium]
MKRRNQVCRHVIPVVMMVAGLHAQTSVQRPADALKDQEMHAACSECEKMPLCGVECSVPQSSVVDEHPRGMNEGEIRDTLLSIARSGHDEAFEALLQSYPYEVTEMTKDIRDDSHKTLLHLAVRNGMSIKLISRLLELGCDVNAKDCNDICAIHLVAGRGNKSSVIAKMLIEHGAELEVQDRFGNTPLHWAIAEGDAGVVAQLFVKKVRTDVLNMNGRDAYHAAVDALQVCRQELARAQDRDERKRLQAEEITRQSIVALFEEE